ncbi:MAG: M20/M25/M40 family metallo-hydrolase [Chloroflexales bacterium]|nr:M20/M25/M40 family metallo-hydrolase [Chloroflexales bacterium]
MDIEFWQADPLVQAAFQQLGHYEPVLKTAIAIQQIPAPTFSESERSIAVYERMRALGLQDVERDALGNVYGRRPGRSSGPALLVSAHLDTVFPVDADLSIRREGLKIYGPGLGDNSLGIAALLHLAEACTRHDLPHQRDIWFVSNVGEEGLGDLCGMRAVTDKLGSHLGAAIVLEGCDFGSLHHQAIGVRRYRIDVEAPGGHSWGDFGNPSAIHALVRLAARLTEIVPPTTPRTTFNIGVINGGTSVNTIAQHASLLLDMRSVEPETLRDLVAQVDAIIAAAVQEHAAVKVAIAIVGDRPTGAIARMHPLVQMAVAAYNVVGGHVTYQQGSTDANIPLSYGIPSVCIGLTDGGNAHRNDEYIKPANLGRGMQALLLLAMMASSGEL